MELINIKKTGELKAEISLSIGDIVKKHTITYTDGDIFSIDFPEELRRFLRLVPSSITHKLFERIEHFLTADKKEFPFEMEIEKEILQMV